MIVVDILNNVLLRFQSGLKAKPVLVYLEKIKPYLGEDKPTWFVPKE